MHEVNAEMARQLLEKAREPNVVQAIVEVDNLKNRNIHRWVQLDARHLLDFPVLTLDFLKDLTIGIYQVKLASSYVQDKLYREADDIIEVEMLKDEDQLPQPGFLRTRVFSRFRNATKYQTWIAYQAIGDNDVDDQDDAVHENNIIKGYYCTCRSGARTIGTCAHVSSVLWFLGYARHQENIRYPSTKLVQSVLDAGNRQVQGNVDLPEVLNF